MADYERSSQATYRAYKPYRERTSDWVSRLPPKHTGKFEDPAMPPSDPESVFYSSDSEAESSRSVPPPFVLRFPDGREERVSDGYYSNANAPPRSVRSRVTSGPVNSYRSPSSHHHSRSLSLHPTTGHPQAHSRVSGPLFRPHSSNATARPEEIRVLPPQRSTTPGHVSSRSAHRSPAQAHLPRNSSVLAPSPRRGYSSGDHDPSDSPHRGPSDNWVMKHGPPQAIAYSNSHPPSKYDMPTRDYSANGYRPYSSSKLSRQSVIGSPVSQMTQLTKENTIANSHSRAFARVISEDDVEDEEWEKEQQRAAYRRGRTSSQSSNSPTLTHSRSRTNSSSSRSNHYVPGPKVQLSVSSALPHRWPNA